MASFSVEAVVLRRRDVGEADRLLTVFSRTTGKQRLIAKGVRRLTSRMAAHLEPGRRVCLHIVERRRWPLVTQAETREVFLIPGAPLEHVRDVFQLLEVVDVLTDDGQRDSRLYDLLTEALRATTAASSTDRTLVRSGFVLQALALLGFTLELQRCLACSRSLVADDSSEVYLSPERGGVTHRHCGTALRGSFTVGPALLHLLRTLQATNLTSLTRRELAPAHTTPRALSALAAPLRAFVEWTSDHPLQTARLLSVEQT